MEQTPRVRTLLYEAMLLLVAIIWGGGFMATRIAIDAQLSSPFILMVRFIIAAAVFGLAFRQHLRQNFSRPGILSGILMGTVLFIAFTSQTIAMEYANPSNVGFLTSTNVVMVPLLWWAFAHRRPPARVGVACVLALLGIAALSFQWGEAFVFSAGDLLALLCSLFFATHITLTGLFSARHDAKVLVFVQFTTAAVLSFLFFLLFDRDFSAFRPSMGLAAVGYLGLFSTCLCFFFQTVAQSQVPASSAALLLCTESLFCTIFSVLMGYEPVTLSMIVGGTVIFSAVLLCELPAGHKKRAS